MILQRQVVIKAVVTEQLKQELSDEISNARQRVDDASAELDRQSRRLMLEMQRTDLQRAMAFRQQIEAEKKKHDDARAQLADRLAQYEQLAIGEEIVRDVLEGYVDLQVGDNLMAALGSAEILVEDGVVKEIREPSTK